MPEHRAQLGLDRPAERMRHAADLAGHRDVFLQVEPRAVDHDRVVAQVERVLDRPAIVHPLALFVYDRRVVEMQARYRGVRMPTVLLTHRVEAAGAELLHVGPRTLDEPERLEPHERFGHGLEHGKVGHVERGHEYALVRGGFHDLRKGGVGVEHGGSPQTWGPAGLGWVRDRWDTAGGAAVLHGSRDAIDAGLGTGSSP